MAVPKKQRSKRLTKMRRSLQIKFLLDKNNIKKIQYNNFFIEVLNKNEK